MDGESSTRLSPTPEKQKRLRDLSNDGESTFVNRGKPVSEKWKPVWMWLQSLGRTKIVDSTEVAAWLECNAAYATEMKQYHSHGVLVHYVQKCHQRLIHGRNYRGEGKKVRIFTHVTTLCFNVLWYASDMLTIVQIYSWMCSLLSQSDVSFWRILLSLLDMTEVYLSEVIVC